MLLGPAAASAQTRYEPNWQSLDQRPCPQWFLDAKFGIFIHWGVYAVPSWGKTGEYAEWYWNRIYDKKPDNVWWQYHRANYGENFEYQDFAPQFRAELFDADQWADIFARSGAQYIVPTSKHHEGFCLWPSAEASKTWGRPWNAVEIGPKRDLMAELSTATRKRGLKFGFYYSLYEWYNPLWLTDRKRYVDEHFIPQFKDVVTRYQPAIIFSRRRMGHAVARTGRARNCWPGCSTRRRARMKWSSTTAGARIAGTSTADTGPPNTPPA